MDDREKENREYEEFLKTFGGRYGSEQETAKAVTATNLPQETKQNEPQEKMQISPFQKNQKKRSRQRKRPYNRLTALEGAGKAFSKGVQQTVRKGARDGVRQ